MLHSNSKDKNLETVGNEGLPFYFLFLSFDTSIVTLDRT